MGTGKVVVKPFWSPTKWKLFAKFYNTMRWIFMKVNILSKYKKNKITINRIKSEID